jgi:WD40 repeat protein
MALDGGDAGLELEHAIGFAGSAPSVLKYQQRSKNKFIYAAGGSLVVADFEDPHDQCFFQGHDDNISCVALSPSGGMIASGQVGENADVIVWAYDQKRLIYRFQEHDYGIQALAFSHDERLLATVGTAQDNKLIVWDLATGKIVASMVPKLKRFSCVAFGGMVRDVKRRDTSNYQLAVAGNGDLMLLSLDPYAGTLEAKAVNMGSCVRQFTCLSFAEDNELLYAGSNSGDVTAVRLKTGVVDANFAVCRVGVCAVETGLHASGQAMIFVGGGDGSASAWTREVDYYGKCRYTKVRSAQLEGAVTSVSLLRRAGAAASGGPADAEALFGTATGFVKRMPLLDGPMGGSKNVGDAQLLVCENHCGPVVAASYCPGISDRFATIGGGADCSIRIWDASDYTVAVKTAVRDAGTPTSVDFSLDHIFTGWDDGRVRCHGAFDGRMLWFIDEAHKVCRGAGGASGAVSALRLSNNHKFLISGGESGAVRVWEVRTKELVSHLKEHKSQVSQLALFNDDVHCLSCSQDRSFLCWDLREEKRISSHVQRTGGINAISLSRDQTFVITCGKERSITFWDLRDPYPAKQIQPAHDGEGTCIATLNGSDHVFATGGTDQVVKLWDARTCRVVTEGLGHSGCIRDVQFSPDDKQLLSVGDDGNIFVWNLYL